MPTIRVSNQGKPHEYGRDMSRESEKWGMANTTSSESTKARDHLEGLFRMDRSGSLYNI
jgi:hypothetical protein